jgi:putative flippase GtrA
MQAHPVKNASPETALMILRRERALLPQFWRFCLVGVAAFVVNAGLVEMLVQFLGPVRSQMIAFPVAATAAWWLNRQYTFGASGLAAHREWLQYVLANSAGWLINNGIYLVLVVHCSLAYAHPFIAVAAGSISGLAANFFLSRRMVFKRKSA